MDSQVLMAFGLTLFAGLSTGVGSAIAFFAKRTNTRLLASALGLSAGVMIYISFVELLKSSFADLTTLYGEKLGQLYTVLAFFGGILLIMIIDFLVPEQQNPHEPLAVSEIEAGIEAGEQKEAREKAHPEQKHHPGLMRVGLMTALVLAIHNFPEGMVTFLSGLRDLSVAIPIAIAIAIHNIPEGISVSIPIYYATGNKKKAFWISFASGLAEPLGAVVGYLILAPYLNETMMGIMNAVIAGIMVFISMDELLPAAEKYGKHHHAIVGLIVGMAVMAFSLILL